MISFDPNEIILDTEQGMLMIQGEELHVTKLTVEKGEVEIEGLVYSMVYSDEGGMTGEKGGVAKEVIPLDGKQKNSRGNHKTTAAFFLLVGHMVFFLESGMNLPDIAKNFCT